MNIRTSLMAFGAAALLGACGTAPMSLLDGRLQSALPDTRYPVYVLSVDGHINFRPEAQVAPGTHTVVLQAGNGRGANQDVQHTVALTVAPCTRYYLAAHRDSPYQRDWSLLIDSTEPVGGCDPRRELRKAELATR
jgi:hypothetical protein